MENDLSLTDKEAAVSANRRLESREQLVQQYFWFLVDEYGFKYFNESVFRSEKMLIQVLLGHKTPRIDIHKIGEPDPDLFKLDFEWVIKFFHGTSPSENHDYLKYKLAENVVFISKIFRENAQKIVNEFDDWWIPAHVFVYKTIEKKYKDEGHIELFLENNKYYYDYLKSKGAL